MATISANPGVNADEDVGVVVEEYLSANPDDNEDPDNDVGAIPGGAEGVEGEVLRMPSNMDSLNTLDGLILTKS